MGFYAFARTRSSYREMTLNQCDAMTRCILHVLTYVIWRWRAERRKSRACTRTKIKRVKCQTSNPGIWRERASERNPRARLSCGNVETNEISSRSSAIRYEQSSNRPYYCRIRYSIRGIRVCINWILNGIYRGDLRVTTMKTWCMHVPLDSGMCARVRAPDLIAGKATNLTEFP